MRDLRAHGVDVVTIGQYLQPSAKHAEIDRWVHPDEFRWLREQGEALGFGSVFAGPARTLELPRRRAAARRRDRPRRRSPTDLVPRARVPEQPRAGSLGHERASGSPVVVAADAAQCGKRRRRNGAAAPPSIAHLRPDSGQGAAERTSSRASCVTVTLRAGTAKRRADDRMPRPRRFHRQLRDAARQGSLRRLDRGPAPRRTRRPRRRQAAGAGVPDRRPAGARNARGRPEAAPRVRFGRGYGVTVSVCTTCVVPGVTFEVMPATVLYVPAFFARRRT